MADLTIHSALPLKHTPGAKMPQIALGVFQSRSPLQSTVLGFKYGYRHIDSARFYHNEEEVGQAFRQSGLKREDVWLTTKILSSDHSTKACQAAVKDSTERLGKGEIWDLILLHDPNGGKAKRLQAWRVLSEAKKAGTVRSIGVSNFGVRHMEEMEEAGGGCDVNQVELHPWCQQKEIVDYCNKKGIIVQAYCPLVRGEKHGDKTLQAVAKRAGKTEGQVLVRWSLQKGFVPLPKSDNESRIKENIGVFGWSLDAESMKMLDGLDQGAKGAISWNPVNAP